MTETIKSIPRDTGNAKQAALRLFLVDEKTGQPVAGVVVSIFADSPSASRREPTHQGSQRQTLATLQTDQAGYVSFKFDRSIVAESHNLAIAYGAVRGDVLVLNVTDLLAGSDTYTIQVDASVYTNIPRSGLPAVMLPDIKDLTVSPASIGFIPHLAIGSGLCSQLTPTTMGVRRFGAFLIRADICHPFTADCGDKIQIVRGQMLEYEIAWNPLGTALGDLLNTITLAPCEQVNIAVADWMRRETASQSQATDIQQQSFQEMNHDRLIVETMQSSVKNKSSSWAIGGKVSAGGSVPVTETVKLDITAAYGGGYAKSQSVHDVALNTTNQLSEHITQAASFVASQRSTVVFQATASEHQTYQTRTVRNNNHCHTLTFMYYQINRNYEVVTDFKGQRDVVLVKYDNKDFDAERAYCNAELLKDALLDQSLLGCFDELADALFCCELTPMVVKERLMDSVTITFWVQENNSNAWNFNGSLNLANGTTVPISVQGLQQWHPGTMHSITVAVPNIDPKLAVSVTLGMGGNIGFGNTPIMTFSKIEVTAHFIGGGQTLSLYSSQTNTTLSGVVYPSWLAWLKASTADPDVDNKNECVEKSCCIQKLLGHLNCHKRYYNGVLALNEDPNERVIRWSCCVVDEPFNLITQIENDPITVYGDFLVFPAAGSQLVDNPAVLPVSNLVTMPTPGVYAEGILGQCDTCEKIDPDRFWNWKDSPCQDNAPTVSAPSTPQTGVKPDDLKADAISNLITFTNVPGAVGSSRVDLQACKLEYSIVSPK